MRNEGYYYESEVDKENLVSFVIVRVNNCHYVKVKYDIVSTTYLLVTTLLF